MGLSMLFSVHLFERVEQVVEIVLVAVSRKRMRWSTIRTLFAPSGVRSEGCSRPREYASVPASIPPDQRVWHIFPCSGSASSEAGFVTAS
jgi:hypothetical protein